MGDLIDMEQWRRDRTEGARQTLQGSIPNASHPANDGEFDEPEEGDRIVEEILFLADSRGVAVKQVLEQRLARERRESHGMRAIGALAEFGRFPDDVDDRLRRWAAARDVTLDELLRILLDEL